MEVAVVAVVQWQPVTWSRAACRRARGGGRRSRGTPRRRACGRRARPPSSLASSRRRPCGRLRAARGGGRAPVVGGAADERGAGGRERARACAPCPPRVRAASRAHLGARVAGEALHRLVPRHHLAVGVGGDARDVHAVDGRRPRRRPAAGARLRRRRARRHRRVVLLRQQLGDGEHADQAALDVVVGVRAEREHLHVAARAEEGHLDAVDHLPLQRLREHAQHARPRRLLDVLHQRAAEDVARRHAGQLGDLRVPLDQRARDVGAQDRQQPRRHPHLVGDTHHPRVRTTPARAHVTAGLSIWPSTPARCMCSWRSGCRLDIACELSAQIARASAQIARASAHRTIALPVAREVGAPGGSMQEPSKPPAQRAAHLPCCGPVRLRVCVCVGERARP